MSDPQLRYPSHRITQDRGATPCVRVRMGVLSHDLQDVKAGGLTGAPATAYVSLSIRFTHSALGEPVRRGTCSATHFSRVLLSMTMQYVLLTQSPMRCRLTYSLVSATTLPH